MYKLILVKNAKKFLDKLPTQERERIVRKLHSICKEPFSHLKKLQKTPLWRLRVGKYRAVVDVIVKRHRIIVIRIGKRDSVY